MSEHKLAPPVDKEETSAISPAINGDTDSDQSIPAGGNDNDIQLVLVPAGNGTQIDAVPLSHDDDFEDKSSSPFPTTLDDIGDVPEISYEARVAAALANNPQQPCRRDSKKDDMISKYSTYGSIPVFIAAILVTLFTKAKYRSPWSFLLLGIGCAVLAVGALMRVLNNRKCPCSLCETQGKNLRSSTALWGLLTVGSIIATVVFFII